MVKLTFSLPEATAQQIRLAASRLGKAQSHIVRDAVADYTQRTDRLSEAERLRMLSLLHELRDKPRDQYTRTAAEAEAEIEEVRATRRLSGHGTPVR